MGSTLDLHNSTGSGDPLAPLVRAALGGDQHAERELLDRLSEPLRRRLRNLLDSHADVDDVVQESLLAVIDALPGFRGQSTVLTYALRIGVLHALSRRRSFGRRKHRLSELLRLESSLPPSWSPLDDQAHSAGMRFALTRALHSIPILQADAFVQRVAFDRSPAEIAAQRGISVHTVRTRLRLALKSLRKQFDGGLQPAPRRAR